MKFAAILLLTGCAALPACPNPEINVVRAASGEFFFVLDAKNSELLRQLVRGLMERSCDVPEREEASGTPS